MRAGAGRAAIALFPFPATGVSSLSLPARNSWQRPRKAIGEEERMHGLIAAAGLGTRLQDLGDKRNKVLLDLGGETILATILRHFEHAGIGPILTLAGFDAPAVRTACGTAAECILNPFYQHYGILSSVWLARPRLDRVPFLFTTGDHYFNPARLTAFLGDQPDADVLVDVELKACDDEDMKVFLDRAGKLRTLTKTMLRGPVLGEFTGLVRFSADGSTQFFEALERHVWQHGIQGYVADVLCTLHRKWELAFYLSNDHRRVEVDFPYDLDQARELYREESSDTRQTG
jgi:choline kinase